MRPTKPSTAMYSLRSTPAGKHPLHSRPPLSPSTLHLQIAHAIQSGSLTDAATAYMDMYEEGVLPLSNTYETLLMAADYQPNRTPGPRGGPNAQRSSADDPMDVLSLEFMLRVLNDMRRAGCRPGVELYNKLLFVCGQRRQPELSASLLHDLRGLNDGAPDVETLCAVIRVLGRSGRLDEAFAIVFGEEWHAGFASRERVVRWRSASRHHCPCTARRRRRWRRGRGERGWVARDAPAAAPRSVTRER